MMKGSVAAALGLVFATLLSTVHAFCIAPSPVAKSGVDRSFSRQHNPARLSPPMSNLVLNVSTRNSQGNGSDDELRPTFLPTTTPAAAGSWKKQWGTLLVGMSLAFVTATTATIGWSNSAMAEDAMTPTGTTTLSTTTTKSYDGFADYAKENQMEKSDVGCFVRQCGPQTRALFSNPRGIKGITCLGRCKGEQTCATRCFAEYGSETLDNWLACTIEENECVKVPKNVDNSAEEIGYSTTVQNFDPSTLVGKWYKTDGLNPNYDLYDCQTNVFEPTGTNQNDKYNEFDMGIYLRVPRPEESGGGYWDNYLLEHMIVDTPQQQNQENEKGVVPVGEEESLAAGRRTMHTSGSMYGLKFDENWYILGESDGRGDIPEFKLVAYKGHTLQGNYEGSFVYAREPVLPDAARDAVRAAAAKAGLNFDDYTPIDNTCPTNVPALNAAAAQSSETSAADWLDLVVGEGGIIDWISPGWRGEYKN